MFKSIKKILFYFFVFVFTAFFIFLGFLFVGGRDAAILMYHSVGEPVTDSENLNMNMTIFEKEMKFLHDHRYNVISLIELVDILKANKRIPPKTVVLTFDDGYENNYSRVFPVLKKYNLPATIFVIIGLLGKEKEFYGHVYKFLDKSMVREMSDSGLITIGSHTIDHIILSQLKNEAELRKEIFKSKAILGNLLGKQVDLFCYPVGGYNKHVEDLVREAGYKAAVTTFPKKKGFAHSDIYALKRSKATKSIGFNMFVFFVETSGYYMRLKETVR